jgi:hypothetical protein
MREKAISKANVSLWREQKKRKYGNECSIANPESWKFQRGGLCMGGLTV